MSQPGYEMDSKSRSIVLQTLPEVCSHRSWNLLTARVRTNHVHVIAEAEAPPEKVMNDSRLTRAEI
jgi:REP element-mobilizing transposase RayT